MTAKEQEEDMELLKQEKWDFLKTRKLCHQTCYSYRKTLKPCTNMCVSVTHEIVVHWKHWKSDFPVFEACGISLWEFTLHNRCETKPQVEIFSSRPSMSEIIYVFKNVVPHFYYLHIFRLNCKYSEENISVLRGV